MTDPNSRPIPRRALLAAALPLVAAGCGALPVGKPPPKLYTLSPKSTFPDDLQRVDFQLGVDRPSSPAGLATNKIAVSRGPLQLDYYAGVVWVDDAANMVQRLLIESFENSGKIVGVGREAVGLRSNFVIRTELREFQAEYFEGATEPVIHVAINCKLVQMPRRVILATQTARSKVKAPTNRMQDIVESFDLALGRALRDIVVWTLSLPETRAFGQQS